MIRKILGVLFLLIGVLFILILLTYGGPVFPHVFGPIILSGIGVILLTFKRMKGISTK